MKTAAGNPTAGAREWVGLAVLVLPCLLVSMDVSVLLFAMPFISAHLAPSGTQLLWIMDMYGFVRAGMMEHFWWGSAFLVNLPAMVLLLVLGPVLLPEFRNPAGGRFDLPGSLLSLAAVLPAVYGIKELAVDGWSTGPAAAIVVGLIAGAVFWHRQRTTAYPLIDLRLFRRRSYRSAVAVNLVTNFALLGFSLYTMQYLQVVRGMSPLVAGCGRWR